MKLAIIGSGNVGKALATSAVRGGHDVTLTASTPENAAEAAQKTGAKAAASNAEAVAGADIVILAIPAASASAVVSELGAALEGKTVVDVTNRVNPGDPGSVLDGDSVTEQIMVLVPRANFVKAFNTVFAAVMANPTVDGAPADAFIAGDNAGPKRRSSSWRGRWASGRSTSARSPSPASSRAWGSSTSRSRSAMAGPGRAPGS